MSRSALLIVDDDEDVLIAARMALRATDLRIETSRTPKTIPDHLASGGIDVLLLDMNFTAGAHDGAEGLDWLARARAADPAISVVLMTAHGGVSLAVDALKRGAADFVLKPWQNEKLVATVSAALALARSRREAGRLEARNAGLAAALSASTDIVFAGPAMRRVVDVIARAAPSDANMLILGESGTGKELVARELHRLSRRSAQAFVSVDAGAVAESLFESDLFGHKRGAFTGASSDRVGRIQAADGGTLFLDEISNLPLHLQSKLLTVLERREVVPLGANKPVPIDVRLVTATNRPMQDLLREDVFRQDLLFRIKTVEIELPPLRQRPEDIPVLVDHFLDHYARRHHQTRKHMSDEARRRLDSYAWPGNVRELRFAVERATILSNGPVLQAGDFPLTAPPAKAPAGAELDLEKLEAQTIRAALTRFGGNVSQAAAALGLTRPALYRRMAKHGL